MENTEVETDNTQPEGEPDSEKSEKTQTEATLTREQKSKLDSFDRIYGENKELKDRIAKLTPKEEPKEQPKGTSNNDPKTMVRLSKALGNFNEDEIDFIYQVAKDSTPEAIIEASKDEWVKTAITAKREKVAKEKKIPESSIPQGDGGSKPPTSEEIKKDPTVWYRWAEEEARRIESQKGI